MKNRNHTRPSLLGLACALLLALGQAAATPYQDLSTDNTSRRLSADRWEWTVFVKASPEALKSISCVEYKLPATISSQPRKVCVLGTSAQPFAVKGNSIGAFEIPVRVIFKNGQSRSLKHKLRLQ
jgi:transcription initiation factor IIF auxiliary subunit